MEVGPVLVVVVAAAAEMGTVTDVVVHIRFVEAHSIVGVVVDHILVVGQVVHSIQLDELVEHNNLAVVEMGRHHKHILDSDNMVDRLVVAVAAIQLVACIELQLVLVEMLLVFQHISCHNSLLPLKSFHVTPLIGLDIKLKRKEKLRCFSTHSSIPLTIFG